MANSLSPVSSSESKQGQQPIFLKPDSSVTVQTLIDAFLVRRSTNTRKAYEKDLADFAAHLLVQDNQAALLRLVSSGQGHANAIVLGYKAALLGSSKSPNTINRRLATLRSAVKLANTLGLINWTISIENERTETYRDTTGPGVKGFRAILRVAELSLNRRKAIRDKAILRLLFDLALRRGEVAGLDLNDLELDSGTLQVMGKGRSQKVALTLPEATRNALSAWLEVRGNEPGPLFVNFDRAGKGKRLSGTSIYRLVQSLGLRIGVKVRPHGLRHAAVTEALDLTDGDVRKVQRFSRHKNVQTLLVYDDNRLDFAAEVARLVAEQA